MDENDNEIDANDRMDTGDDFDYSYDGNEEEEEEEENYEVDYAAEEEEEVTNDDYVDVEYLEEGDEYPEGDIIYLDQQELSRRGLVDDFTLASRQGLFNLPRFGSKKKQKKRKRIKNRPMQPGLINGPLPSGHVNGQHYPGTPNHPHLSSNVNGPPQSGSFNRPIYQNHASGQVYPATYPIQPLAPGFSQYPGTMIPSQGQNSKNIRVKISNKKSPKRKKIRMKIQGLADSSTSGHLTGFGPLKNESVLTNPNTGISNGGIPSIASLPLAQHGSSPQTHNMQGTLTQNYGFGSSNNKPGSSGVKTSGFQQSTKGTGFGGTKASSYGGTKNTGFGSSNYKGTTNTGYGGTQIGQSGVKSSVGWSTLNRMSNSLPDLSKAITVMSFIAFSVFVANLGVNALANSTLGVTFGRSEGDWVTKLPDFSLDGMIHDLDKLFEEKENKNGEVVSTFDEVIGFVEAVYNELYQITKNEVDNVKGKITNFIGKDFSEDDLPLGDISKGFLARKLNVGEPYSHLDDFCYRKLLCLSHNLTRKYKGTDNRNKLLPFWTFGIGWFKSGESQMTSLLENLRAELAGESGRDCHELFPTCTNPTIVTHLLKDMEEELKHPNGNKADDQLSHSISNLQKINDQLQPSISNPQKINDQSEHLISNQEKTEKISNWKLITTSSSKKKEENSRANLSQRAATR